MSPSVFHHGKYREVSDPIRGATPDTTRRGRALPSGRFLGVAAAIATAVLVAAAWVGFSYFDSIDRLSRGADPAVVELRTNPGRIVVYYEGRFDPSLSELGVEVAGPGGTRVAVQPFPYDLRYDVGKLVGHAVAVFDAPTAGTYVVTSRIQEPAGRLAVGADLGVASVGMVLAVIGAVFTIALAVIVALLLALLRADERRRTTLSASWLRKTGGQKPAE